MLDRMSLGIAIGSGALISITLAVWLVLAYRRNAQLAGDVASMRTEVARLGDALTAQNATLAKVTRDSADQAARDAVRIAALEHDLDEGEADAIERGLAPGGDLAEALSRAGINPHDHEGA